MSQSIRHLTHRHQFRPEEGSNDLLRKCMFWTRSVMWYLPLLLRDTYIEVVDLCYHLFRDTYIFHVILSISDYLFHWSFFYLLCIGSYFFCDYLFTILLAIVLLILYCKVTQAIVFLMYVFLQTCINLTRSAHKLDFSHSLPSHFNICSLKINLGTKLRLLRQSFIAKSPKLLHHAQLIP